MSSERGTNTQLHTKSRVNRQANQGVTDILTSGPYKCRVPPAKAGRLDVIKGAFINLDPHDIYVI